MLGIKIFQYITTMATNNLPNHTDELIGNANEPSLRTAKQLAYQIMTGFDKSFRYYSYITAGAQKRFEQCLWTESQQAISQRISIYESSLAEAVSDIYQKIHPHTQSSQFWMQTKQAFAAMLADHPQFELAETFYNSVIGRIFKHDKLGEQTIFEQANSCHLVGFFRHRVINELNTKGSVRDLFNELFATYRFNAKFDRLERDLQQLELALRQRLTNEQLALVWSVHLLKPVFYRGKAAYLVGRMCMPNETLPFVIALQMNANKAIIVDALLTERAHVSVIFSFARSYFMANTQHPAEVVAFLQELLPHKKNFELYMSLGFFKHGKTVFYRDYLSHLKQSNDNFELAPGIKGLVMTVFHMPSYGVVFKVIKDEFAESKKVTRQQVKDCYTLVKNTDRVGRMADTHEYMYFHFPRARFCPELLDYLQTTCANSLEITTHEVILKHLYIERKMTPLNIYLAQESNPEKIRSAIDDLGRCIKQIASANIFPGDMLHKNFGITKTGRVIFYDYDEICFMHERQFRALPKNDDPFALDTLSVGPQDVFPEQFEHFIVGKKHLKDLLKELHGDLFDPKYWLKIQAIAAKGDVEHFIPYPPSLCFVE